jgi:hypothetical protein
MICCVDGVIVPRVGDKTFEIGPGDNLSIPQSTSVLYEGRDLKRQGVENPLKS